MTVMDRIIFVGGVCAVVLLIAGVLYTISEFREIGRHLENQPTKHYWGEAD